MKHIFFVVPKNVEYVEAADLFRLMAIGESDRKVFLDRKHQILFDHLTHLQEQVGPAGTELLIQSLTDEGRIDDAGGIAYVKKVFNGLEPSEVYP